MRRSCFNEKKRVEEAVCVLKGRIYVLKVAVSVGNQRVEEVVYMRLTPHKIDTPAPCPLVSHPRPIDPKNDNVWSTWIAMEEEIGFLDKADDLRIRQAEQQWEFEVPFNFTTRPTESPLAGLVDTLSKFFLAREQGQGRRSGGLVASGNGGK